MEIFEKKKVGRKKKVYNIKEYRNMKQKEWLERNKEKKKQYQKEVAKKRQLLINIATYLYNNDREYFEKIFNILFI